MSTIKSIVLGTVVLAALLSSTAPARAQVEGWYLGTASDGSQFGMYLSRDSAGQLYLNNYNYYGLVTCPSGATHQENTSFGVYEPAVPHVDYEMRDDSYYTRLVGDFSADGLTFTGTAKLNMPKFTDPSLSVRRSEVCLTGARRIVATWDARQSTVPPPRLQKGERRSLPLAR
jgi:hypothetical protein